MTGQRGVVRPADIAAIANEQRQRRRIEAFDYHDSIFKDGLEN